MSKKTGLGRGLESLIPSSANPPPTPSALPASGINLIAVENIVPNPMQPRSKFDTDELAELAASIKEHGVIQPLVATRGSEPEQYILIAGERRLEASKIADLREVPVHIRETQGDQEMLELALIENVQRADLSPLETAEAYRQLAEAFNLTQEQIAQRVSKSRVSVTNTISLLDMASVVKQALAERDITEGHARAMKGLNHHQQAAALSSVLKNDLNVRQTEELARGLKGEKPPKKSKPSTDPEVAAIQNKLRDSLSTKVKLTYGPKGGTIVLHYYSDEELNALYKRLTGDDL